jgi:hypothetical protein
LHKAKENEGYNGAENALALHKVKENEGYNELNTLSSIDARKYLMIPSALFCYSF